MTDKPSSMIPPILRDGWELRDIIIVVLTPIVLLPLPLGGSSESACAYVVIVTAVFWITEALPIAVTSLLPIFLLPVTGVMGAKDVSSAYMNDTSMLFIGGLLVAAAIETWNIHKRIALRVLLFTGSEPRWLMMGLMLPTWFLSMWISNTATTAMMVPIANAVLVQLKQAKSAHIEGKENLALELDDIEITGSTEKKDINDRDDDRHTSENAGSTNILSPEEEDEDLEHKRMCKALCLCIAYSANVGGTASLTGTFPNIVMKGQADIIYQNHGSESGITFNTWMLFGLPTSFLVLIVLWCWLTLFLLRCRGCGSKTDPEVKEQIKSVIRQEYNKLGSLTFAQIAVLGHFLLLALLWITRDLGGVGGWGDMFTAKFATDSTPSIFVGMLLFIFPSALPAVFCCRPKSGSQKIKPLLDWNTTQSKLPWGVFLLLGGGFALAKASSKSGLSAWLAEELNALQYLEPWVINLILCYIATFATEVTSNTAICTLIMPIIGQLALNLHVNPLYFMLPTAIATSFAFMLPVATPPNAIVFSYGHLRVVDMCISGFTMNILSVLVLILATETWGNAYFGFQSFPSIFLANSTLPIPVPRNLTNSSLA
ncbi:hypothetical protein ScPMuIL_005378 [Solemya velum]